MKPVIPRSGAAIACQLAAACLSVGLLACQLQGCGGQGPAASPPVPTLPADAGGSSQPSVASQAGAGAADAKPAEVVAATPCTPGQPAGEPGLQEYKLRVACHLHQRNQGRLFAGAPPPVLGSVIVLSLKIDPRGQPEVKVLRSNGLRDNERRALQAVREASPLPPPPSRLLRRGTADLTETWLFRDDGQFQLRSLALEQAAWQDR